MNTTKQLKGITPILQNLLINQINAVMNALNDFNYLAAWGRLDVLIRTCPPKVRNHENSKEKAKPYYGEPMPFQELAQINARLNTITGSNNVNVVLARVRQSNEGMKVLRARVKPLFTKIVELLYEGGYLEVHKQAIPSGQALDYR